MTSTPAFAGWYRPDKRHRWIKLAEADDYGNALNALVDAAAKLSSGAELLVSQQDPNKGQKRP